MMFRSLALSLLGALPAAAMAAPTEILPLSGMGEKGETAVYWDFRLDTGRGSGEWKKIGVPSQWEQEGFGTYYYGTQGRGKPDADPVIPKETGAYKRQFEIPEKWSGRAIHIVFEAAMTDTTVFVNGTQAGDTHQGGFYRFSYDITNLVKPGTNDLEVRVSQESANKSVNHAERRGDYWTFSGIYRPVWLEARPRHHISWTAIDARADGSFSAQLHFDQAVPRNTRARAQLLDAKGALVGAPLEVLASRQSSVTLSGKFPDPALWTAETPNLYRVKFTLEQGRDTLHELTQRFGFRTLEVKPNDGVYLNGSKIVLKGVNRHSFRPATGRTLTREQNYEDARLIRSMNMNAVRMSHYPPDPAFLEAADELGLYVLNELAGWQGFYDTPTGARLIGQIVRRDVNHPSILFWDNGNEGGWNTDNDGEFARWDPQKRPVLHPWAIHSDINTDHYEKYESTVRLSKGPQIFMPTEFLHGLYDGGIGAGFRDYWDVMGKSPTVAGGFFWVFADEGIERTDQGRRIDNFGNSAPDGIVGPHHEKEGSFYTVKEIWSPVQVSDLAYVDGTLKFTLRNEYDFTSLTRVQFVWKVKRHPYPHWPPATQVLAEGRVAGPDLAPRQQREWSIPIPLQVGVIELSAIDDRGEELWSWTLPVNDRPDANLAESYSRRDPRVKRGLRVSARGQSLLFNADGTLASLRQGDREIALGGPRAIAWLRDKRGFREQFKPGKLRKLELAPRENHYNFAVLARVTYADGPLKSVTWSLDSGPLTMSYELAAPGDTDIFGIRFDAPATGVVSKRWLGKGPYRIWKNRREGVHFDLHEVAWNDPVPGETFTYPEFPGFFAEWRWLRLQTQQTAVTFDNTAGIPFFGLHRPQPGRQPVIDVPDLGWSFLHAIPPIGTKFEVADTLGPQSQVSRLSDAIRSMITITLTPP